VKCLVPSCTGRNRPDANRCAACGVNLADLRLRRWRELDGLLEEAHGLYASRNVSAALSRLQSVLSEPHEEFLKVREDARSLVERIAAQEGLDELAPVVATRARWEAAEQYFRCLALVYPERKDVPEFIGQCREKAKQAEAAQLQAAQEAVQSARDCLAKGGSGLALRKAYGALALLPEDHPAAPEIRDFIQAARRANTLRLRKWFALASAAVMVILIAGHLVLAAHRPSLALVLTVRQMEQDIERNLKQSEPPPWHVPDYSQTATDTFRTPPVLPEGLGRAFVRGAESPSSPAVPDSQGQGNQP
jgi:hypothetical protein